MTSERTPGAPPPAAGPPGGPPAAEPSREVQLYGAAYSLSDDETRASFDEEDERWSARAQVWDWVKLLAFLGLWALWTLLVYFLEPGLR